MRKIYTLGETVLDLIFKNQQPIAAKAGGSMLNVAVSLGRTGVPVYFISEYGTDQPGTDIDQFLQANGVNTTYVHRYPDGKTALALAFLNQQNNASYSFYKAYPANRLNIAWPMVSEHDIVIFGSFYGISPEIRPQVRTFIQQACQAGALLMYDPNFRASHLHELDLLRPAILENMEWAHVIKASDEDLKLMFGIENPAQALTLAPLQNKAMVYTRGSLGAQVLGTATASVPAQPINVVSTIGAGDSFNAGLAWAFLQYGVSSENFFLVEALQWQQILQTATKFAAAVCASLDNYVPAHFNPAMP